MQAVIDQQPLERVRINFEWILKLRWAAAAGQLATILLVRLWFQIELPMLALYAILGFEALSNLVLTGWFRRPTEHFRHGLLERVLGSVMLTDVALLTVLLYLTGGPTNPFSVYYIVNIVLTAVVLSPAWTWGVNGLALLGYSVLLFRSVPLPGLEGGGGDESLYHLGIPVAFGSASVVIAFFVTRVKGALGELELALAEARARKARSERLDALGTLAAGAAHELAFPLSTIAVVAKDLEIALSERGAHGDAEEEDAKLIRREVARCRGILDQMAADAGQSTGTEIVETSIDELIETTLDNLKRRDRVDVRVSDSCRERPMLIPRRSLALALRQVVKNGLDASPATARLGVDVGRDGEHLTVKVTDVGAGMTSATIDRATDPFFTTKEPGQGMGLGLFLAQTVLERLDGRIAFESNPGRGTTVRVVLPLRRLWPDEPERAVSEAD